jgi:hypothetical protein
MQLSSSHNIEPLRRYYVVSIQCIQQCSTPLHKRLKIFLYILIFSQLILNHKLEHTPMDRKKPNVDQPQITLFTLIVVKPTSMIVSIRSSMKISVRPPVVFTELLAPTRHELGANPAVPISPVRILVVVLGILNFCILAYWISKKLFSWYQNRRARAKEQRRRCQEHKTWVKWVCGTRVEPEPPKLPHIDIHHIKDIELGLRRIGRTDSVQSRRSDHSFRTRPKPPKDTRVKATDIYVLEDVSKSGQTSAAMISLAVPLALRFQKQGPFRGNSDHHVPLAPVDAYHKVEGVFRKGAAEPPSRG